MSNNFYDSLTHLNLHRNALLYLPDEISQLQHLTYLDADDNLLKELPNYSSLTSLRVIAVGHNQLTEIPNWIYNLTTLTRVSFRSNLITHISPKLVKLTNLSIFHIETNEIRSFPDDATQLNSLYLHHNNIEVLSTNFYHCGYISLRSSKVSRKYPPESTEQDMEAMEFLAVQRDLYVLPEQDEES
jgi:Leucine-rich repeat (LRR) protein